MLKNTVRKDRFGRTRQQILGLSQRPPSPIEDPGTAAGRVLLSLLKGTNELATSHTAFKGDRFTGDRYANERFAADRFTGDKFVGDRMPWRRPVPAPTLIKPATTARPIPGPNSMLSTSASVSATSTSIQLHQCSASIATTSVASTSVASTVVAPSSAASRAQTTGASPVQAADSQTRLPMLPPHAREQLRNELWAIIREMVAQKTAALPRLASLAARKSQLLGGHLHDSDASTHSTTDRQSMSETDDDISSTTGSENSSHRRVSVDHITANHMTRRVEECEHLPSELVPRELVPMKRLVTHRSIHVSPDPCFVPIPIFGKG